MKRALLVVFLVIFALSAASATNVHFVFGDLAQHPDILAGFLPSYVLLGVGFKPTKPFISGHNTDFQVIVGEGYTQRLLWQDKDSGENNYDNKTWDKTSALRFNVWQNELSLRFVQGFLNSTVENKDLLTLTAFLNARYERYYGGGKLLAFNINGNLPERIEGGYSGKIYPELGGNGNSFLGMEFALSLKLDMMKDTLHTNDGLWAKLDMKYAPEILNSALDGKADYMALTMTVVGAKTLWNLENKNNKSLVSFVLIDRLQGAWSGGKSVPSFIQGPQSLGRKVRGHNTYTYNTEFTVVNNLDLRIAGPGLGLESIAPRINLFFDCGYGWGRVHQTERTEKNFLASIGVEFTASFFDFIDLGYELCYHLTDKDKYTQPGRFTTCFTFFLDF